MFRAYPNSGLQLLCITLLLLLSYACSNGGNRLSPERKTQPDVLTEDIRLLLSDQLQRAEDAKSREQADSAIFWYATVGEVYIETQQWDSLYEIAFKIFRTAYSNKNYETADPHFIKYQDALATANDTIWAKALELHAYSKRATGSIEEALGYYRQAATVWEKYPASGRLLRCYNMMGILYTILADYPLAETIYEKSIVLSQQLKDTTVLRANYANLGEAKLSKNDWLAARLNFEKANALVAYEDGVFEHNMARVFLVGGQAQKAMSEAQKALQKRQNYQGRSWLSMTAIYGSLGETYFKLKDYDNAERYQKKTLQEALDYFPPGHRELGKAYLFLADTYFEKGLHRLALETYQEAIKVFLPSFLPKDIRSCPAADSLLSRETWLMEALRSKGQVLRVMFESNKNLEDLKASALHHQMAVGFINQIKIYYTEKGAKAFWGDYAIPFVEDAIEAQLKLYQQTSDGLYQRHAFELAQQATAFMLRETVNEKQALEIAQVPKDTAAVLYELNTLISEIKTASAAAEDQREKDSLSSELLQIKNDRIRLMERIEDRYPAYFQLKHALSPIPLENLQRELAPNTLAIKYFLGESKLYTFVFSSSNFQVFTTAINESFFQNVETFRNTLSNLEFIRAQPALAEQQFIESSQELYALLIRPAVSAFAADQPTKLIIIPDGILNYLSFECMLSKPVDNWLQTEAFLLSDYTIRYAYYAGLLLKQEGQDEASKFIGFGTSYDDGTLETLDVKLQDSLANPSLQDAFRGKSLSKLIYADDEVLEIADQLSGDHFINEQATKAKFLDHAPHYNLVHVATHSFIDDNDSTAYIIFNKSHQDENFLLSLPEIYQMSLDAQLVTLSGCQTSTGALKRSEGVMSLARAFHFAGSSSLVASQWSIVDRSSFLIMKTFYENLKQGLPKDEALQKAKLAYLQDDQISSPAYRIPAYWGAIVMIGDEQALVFNNSTNFWYYAVAAGLLLILWIGYRKKSS